MNEDSVSKNDGEIVERTLDLSEGAEEYAEVSVEVPAEESGSDYFKYSVKVSKNWLTKAIKDDTFMDFWKKIEDEVMEDIKKV